MSPLHAADSGAAAPATITKEVDLVVLKLTADAEQRLRLKTVAVEKRAVPAVRLFSGEVVTSVPSCMTSTEVSGCTSRRQSTPTRADASRWPALREVMQLPLFARSPWLAVLVLLTTFAGSGWIWHTQLKEEFLPNFKERDFLMHWLEKPNTSVEASKRITFAAAHDLLQVPRRAQSRRAHRSCGSCG